jgi:DMSO/TMAO reductase YedYZ molybdopterin-dependent catalytic subunit
VTATNKDPRLNAYPGGNYGTPPELVDELIVPTSLFFVRSNGQVPKIDARAWRLAVDGFVDTPRSFSLVELKRLPRRRLTAFLECAGNSRTKFDPVPEGTPWANDAIGNAVWTGTSLSNVLDLAGVKRGTVDIVSQGADFEGMQRGLPISVARDPDTMLVWEMNGEPLLPEHGGPVRLFVPRWAGISSTKWIARLSAQTSPFDGYYNADNYIIYNSAGEAVAPVREMPVKSLIATPADGSVISRGPHIITGYAWSGHGGISRVEVSTDDGGSWSDAEVVASGGRLSWSRFELDWNAEPGEYRILSRATDERRLIQPMQAFWNLKGYQNNGVQGVTISVS